MYYRMEGQKNEPSDIIKSFKCQNNDNVYFCSRSSTLIGLGTITQ